MPGRDNLAVSSDGNQDANRQKSPPPNLEGYSLPPRPGINGHGDAQLRGAANDDVAGASDRGAGQQGSLRPDQAAFLKSWREKEKAILDFNLKNDGDGGAHLQNSVYQYTRQVLRQEGLDREGWEAYPVAMNSPLDKIGADILLVNNKTGDMVFLDPTSRRLDPKTGDRVPNSESAKTNVPAIREAGVVDALPRWFERGSGALDDQLPDPAMRDRIADFKVNFRDQLHELTSHPAPFNMKDFPLPYYGPVKDQQVQVDQIKAVVDWAQQKSNTAYRSGERGQAADFNEFGKTLNGALNYSKRTGNQNLHDAMERQVNRVIADEALRRAYPDQAPSPAPNQKKFQPLEGGSNIQVDKNGQLVLNLKGEGSGEAAQDQVVTAGSVPDAFAKSTGYWCAAKWDQQRRAEFKALLPKNVQKAIDDKKISLDKILDQIGDDRNSFAGGGAGIDKPFIGRVVSRLAGQKAEGLRTMLTATAAEVTQPAADTGPAEKARFSPAAVTGEGGKPKGDAVTASGGAVRVTDAAAPTKATASVNGTGGQKQAETSLGRPVAGANGDWQPGKAPAPVVGKVDLPGTGSAGGAKAEVTKPAEHLTPEEVDVLKWAREGLEAKGAANLSTEERELVNSYRFAERELGKPFGNDPLRTGLVGRIREMMGTEAKGMALSAAMLSVVVLNFYQSQKGQDTDTSRAKYY